MTWQVTKHWLGLIDEIGSVSAADRHKYGAGEDQAQDPRAVEVSASVQAGGLTHSAPSGKTLDVDGGVKTGGVTVEACPDHEEGWRAVQGGDVVEDCSICER